MTKKRFTLTARISSDNKRAIKRILEELVPKNSITSTDEGFTIKTTMSGASARELNRILLSTLRRIEKKTRVRSEWTSSGMTERFSIMFPRVCKKSDTKYASIPQLKS